MCCTPWDTMRSGCRRAVCHQTGQHPAITTQQNIERYRSQLDLIGLSFDWDREVRTCDPEYYRWTQWIFMQLYNSWYDNAANKARPIRDLEAIFEKEGNGSVKAACDDDVPFFTAEQWKGFDERARYEILSKYRLTYLSEAVVNWCPGWVRCWPTMRSRTGFPNAAVFR